MDQTTIKIKRKMLSLLLFAYMANFPCRRHVMVAHETININDIIKIWKDAAVLIWKTTRNAMTKITKITMKCLEELKEESIMTNTQGTNLKVLAMKHTQTKFKQKWHKRDWNFQVKEVAVEEQSRGTKHNHVLLFDETIQHLQK